MYVCMYNVLVIQNNRTIDEKITGTFIAPLTILFLFRLM